MYKLQNIGVTRLTLANVLDITHLTHCARSATAVDYRLNLNGTPGPGPHGILGIRPAIDNATIRHLAI